ncbi:MBL fold metallo-hydrolase [Thermosyntropha sp.]|uniref:MBL fold metallo-hydrolase n=1 Tax=Thermosyntropha sp. TaxID=2740820 RepID=UPI0025CBE3FC|nr:MBL fold metallo-hydrolase [Thermosyntropha sp.]MBO8158394.1 MBL fold metallo-hydrolase [Thermosyntropha sp.]
MIKKTWYGPVLQLEMARLFEGKPVYTMACYYVDGLLIDTGPVHVSDEIEEAFKDLPVNIIVNTHHHEDHIGNNIVFQQKRGVEKILAHYKAVERIQRPETWIQRLRAYQHIAWGSPPPSKAQVIGETVETANYQFKVIHTPGHSDDHICLLEPKKGWLFSGDIFIREELKTLRSDENFHEILASLYKLYQYEFSTIFCGSGKIIMKDAKKALKQKIEYFERIKEEIFALYDKDKDIEEITRQVLGEESVLYGPTEGDFGKINLVKSVLTGSEC